jgi:hypothetical protein
LRSRGRVGIQASAVRHCNASSSRHSHDRSNSLSHVARPDAREDVAVRRWASHTCACGGRVVRAASRAAEGERDAALVPRPVRRLR